MRLIARAMRISSIIPALCVSFYTVAALSVSSPSFLTSSTPDQTSILPTTAPESYVAPPSLPLGKGNVFAKLLISLAPPPLPTVISFPPIPQIPNIFFPMISRPVGQNIPSPATINLAPTPSPSQCHLAKRASTSCNMLDNIEGGSSYTGRDEESHTVPSILMPALFQRCSEHRSPNLPVSFAVEVGLVRLFQEPSYGSEGTMVRGCGCINLNGPKHIRSFVGSRNHSFSFYESVDCEGEPFYQRFRQTYDLKAGKVTQSVMITQGLLRPIPGDRK